ncbi:hypothetical protein SLAVM298S_00837 [Streptomyces lavendulae subsp. lavendulae]
MTVVARADSSAYAHPPSAPPKAGSAVEVASRTESAKKIRFGAANSRSASTRTVPVMLSRTSTHAGVRTSSRLGSPGCSQWQPRSSDQPGTSVQWLISTRPTGPWTRTPRPATSSPASRSEGSGPSPRPVPVNRSASGRSACQSSSRRTGRLPGAARTVSRSPRSSRTSVRCRKATDPTSSITASRRAGSARLSSYHRATACAGRSNSSPGPTR